MTRLLVAGVGNVLRRDDGFGPAVVARLPPMPAGVDVVETGIGGVALLQEIIAGCDGLVVVDAIDRGGVPGTLYVIDPQVADAVHVADVHLANPDRVLAIARTMGALPERVVIVGCQPEDADEMGEHLSPAVQRAVEPAVRAVRETVAGWLGAAL